MSELRTELVETDPRDRLAEIAALFYARGWMAGTAGNLSLRLDGGSFWITASGKAKGKLRRQDFLRMSAGGEVLERGSGSDLPSAELFEYVFQYRVAARAVGV